MQKLLNNTDFHKRKIEAKKVIFEDLKIEELEIEEMVEEVEAEIVEEAKEFEKKRSHIQESDEDLGWKPFWENIRYWYFGHIGTIFFSWFRSTYAISILAWFTPYEDQIQEEPGILEEDYEDYSKSDAEVEVDCPTFDVDWSKEIHAKYKLRKDYFLTPVFTYGPNNQLRAFRESIILGLIRI